MRSRRTLNARMLTLCLTCSLFSVHALAAENTLPLAESGLSIAQSDILPQLQELSSEAEDSSVQVSSVPEFQEQMAESEQKAQEEAFAALARETSIDTDMFSKEALADRFGTLPLYLETAFPFFSDYFHLPSYDPSDVPRIVEKGDGYVVIQPIWNRFQQNLTDTLAGYEGDWSIYIKDLNTGRTMSVNDHSIESASLIKLFIAGAVLEQIDLGKLEDSDSTSSLLDAMITVSDNESANALVRLLCGESGSFQSGLDVVNDFIDRYGFSSTQQVNGIADPSLWISDGINLTSAADCGRFLEMVYNGTLVSRSASRRLLKLLSAQEVDYKIPAALPSDVKIAHKTGEVSDAEHDASIIYTPYGDFIFCVMSGSLTDKDEAVFHIRDITETVYEYFTSYVKTGIQTDPEIAEYLSGKPYILLQ